MNLCTLGLLFLVTQYLQTVQDRSALAAGAALLPLFLPLTILAPFTGRLGRVGARPVVATGAVLVAGGIALLTGLRTDSSYLTLLPALLLWGCGLGVLTPAVVAASVAAAPADRSGLASGVNNTARQAGGAIGIAAFGAVAGTASNARAFVSGIHLSGLVSVALLLVASLST